VVGAKVGEFPIRPADATHQRQHIDQRVGVDGGGDARAGDLAGTRHPGLRVVAIADAVAVEGLSAQG
jgi:hypothetical protein